MRNFLQIYVLIYIVFVFSEVNGQVGHSSASTSLNWGDYVKTGLSESGNRFLQITVQGNNSFWHGSFIINGTYSFTPDLTWNNVTLTSWSGVNATQDVVTVLIMSDGPTTSFSPIHIVVKTMPTGLGGSATMHITASGHNVGSQLNLVSSSSAPYAHTMASSVGTYDPVTKPWIENNYLKSNNTNYLKYRNNYSRFEPNFTGILDNIQMVIPNWLTIGKGGYSNTEEARLDITGNKPTLVMSVPDNSSYLNYARNGGFNLGVECENDGFGLGNGLQNADTRLVVNKNNSEKGNFYFGVNRLDIVGSQLPRWNSKNLATQEWAATNFLPIGGGGVSGNLGIGTNSPQSKLHLNVGGQQGLNIPLLLQNVTCGDNERNSIGIGFVNECNGSWLKAAIVQERTRGYGVGPIHFLVNNFESTASTDLSDIRLSIQPNGNVLIGKTTQTNVNYKLDVAGHIRAEKLVVNTTGADFVFDSTYKLPSLVEVEQFIQKNKHLPKIASANEMQTNGLDVGENQTKLLQKIEELTLYIIELDKKVAAQKKELEGLKRKRKFNK